MVTTLSPLAALLAPYIEDLKERHDKKHPELLRAALTCFPAVRFAVNQRSQVTVAAIGQLTSHPDRSVS
jgi:hypothetical protein